MHSSWQMSQPRVAVIRSQYYRVARVASYGEQGASVSSEHEQGVVWRVSWALWLVGSSGPSTCWVSRAETLLTRGKRNSGKGNNSINGAILVKHFNIRLGEHCGIVLIKDGFLVPLDLFASVLLVGGLKDVLIVQS